MSINDKISKILEKVAAFAAVIISVFHMLNVAGVFALSAMTVRASHVMALLSISYLIYKNKKKQKESLLDNVIKIFFALLVVACNLYLLIRWESITSSGGVSNNLDVIVGIVMILVVLEATRKSVGLALSVIVLVFLIYPFIGPYLPSILQNKGYSVSRIFTFLFTTTDGIYGIPISVSSTYIILFCIFGAFLSEFGAGDFMYKLSLSLTKNLVAASAKTSVIFSTLVGMISGSAAGNVAVTGVMTIPMMIKEGYPRHKAGAVEAVASTGGQIMPPVMGAAAFIMAEIMGVPYASIMKAALIPALLYFTSIFIIVHLEAKKSGLDKKKAQITADPFIKVIKEGWYYIIPIVAIIYLLVTGYSPFKSAFFSIVTLLVIYVISRRKLDIDFLKKVIAALKMGALDTVPVATACAASGIIVGVISITGVGSKLSSLIIGASSGQLIVALILTMVVSIILGMGLPTTAAYLVLASVVVPALVKMGISLISAHMFVFFFGCMSSITPPVALASYVAAGIAGTDLNKVGWQAFKYGLASFILPYMFVYGPSLLFEGPITGVITTVIVSIIGIFSIAASIVGYFRYNLKILHRIILFIAGVLLVKEGYITDAIGFALIVIVYLVVYMSNKKTPQNTAITG